MFSRPSQFSLYFLWNVTPSSLVSICRILEEPTASIFGAFTKLRKAAATFVMSFRPSVLCPRETTRLPLEGFSWNFIFQDFSKICGKNSSFIKIIKEKRVLYLHENQYTIFIYLVKFLLEWDMVQKICGKINVYFMFNHFFSKIVPFMR